jgi:hypothetical protein
MKMREQEYANTMLLIMTTMNIFLGILMIFEIIPVIYGMSLAFFGMFGIIWKCKRDLMGDVRLWESPKDYRDRRILRGRFEEESNELP